MRCHSGSWSSERFRTASVGGSSPVLPAEVGGCPVITPADLCLRGMSVETGRKRFEFLHAGLGPVTLRRPCLKTPFPSSPFRFGLLGPEPFDFPLAHPIIRAGLGLLGAGNGIVALHYEVLLIRMGSLQPLPNVREFRLEGTDALVRP